MAGGKTSTLAKVLPLVFIVLFFAGAGWIGYQIYLSANKIRDSASERMGNKNVVFTRDGVRVGVRQVKQERYVDATQSWVVKAWNLGTGKGAAAADDDNNNSKKSK